ncbi:MAG TPA: GrpB family protein, partial [Polyangia bacterium]
MSAILVIDYDPSWPIAFAALSEAIWPVVDDIAISIEHVGSTSVPGLAAKPVIDIDVVVRASEVTRGIVRLASLGYIHVGDRGIPQREAFESPASFA